MEYIKTSREWLQEMFVKVSSTEEASKFAKRHSLNLFKEEEKTINKIMKCGAAFIEEFAPKTLAGFVTYLRSSVVLTVLAHSFPAKDLSDYIYEKTGFRVLVKVVDTITLNEKSVTDYAEKVYFWNNYKSIVKMLDSRNVVKTFFNF